MKSLGPVTRSTKYLFIVLFTVGPYSAFALRAEAALLSGAFETNFYEFVLVSDPWDSANTWQAAQSAASAGQYNGISGHLATITSQEENDFLFGLVSGNFTGFKGGWLGGQHDSWLVGPESGESLSYTNWGGTTPPEPNNSGLMYMGIGTSGFAEKWLDDSGIQGVPSDADPVIGYFVEYEGAIPEPSTLALLSMGALALTIGWWRRRR